MFKLDNDFLTSLGLGGLPVDEKNKLLQMIYERLEMNVGMRLAEKMTDQQLDEFESFIDQNDEAGALKWLETNFPNYKDVVAEELEKLRVEVTHAAPQILAAQTGGQQPPVMTDPAMPGVPMPQTVPGGSSQMQQFDAQPQYQQQAQGFGQPQQPAYPQPQAPSPAMQQPMYDQPTQPMQPPAPQAPAQSPQDPGFAPQQPVQQAAPQSAAPAPQFSQPQPAQQLTGQPDFGGQSFNPSAPAQDISSQRSAPDFSAASQPAPDFSATQPQDFSAAPQPSAPIDPQPAEVTGPQLSEHTLQPAYPLDQPAAAAQPAPVTDFSAPAPDFGAMAPTAPTSSFGQRPAQDFYPAPAAPITTAPTLDAAPSQYGATTPDFQQPSQPQPMQPAPGFMPPAPSQPSAPQPAPGFGGPQSPTQPQQFTPPPSF